MKKYVYFNWYGIVARLSCQDAKSMLSEFMVTGTYSLNKYKSLKTTKYKVNYDGDVINSKRYIPTINLIQLEDMENDDRNFHIELELKYL